MKKIKGAIFILTLFMAFVLMKPSVSVKADEGTVSDYLKTGKEVADALGAAWDSKTGTVILKKNVVLKKKFEIYANQPIKLDLNGHRISKESICIRGGRRVDIVGEGVFENCTIVMDNIDSMLVLKGDITYKSKNSAPVLLKKGGLVIKNGSFSGKKYALKAIGSSNAWSHLYIYDGTFCKDVVSYVGTSMYGGTIKGKLMVECESVYIQDGRIEGGIVCRMDNPKSECYVTICGGKVLDQIKLGTRASLEISGGIIKSSKESVILAEGSPSSDGTCYSRIEMYRGTIISTAKNGYGIKARQANINITGGTIKNTTKKGCCGVYNAYYHYDCNGVNESATKKAKIEGFKSKVKSSSYDNSCGKDVYFSFDEKTGTLTISGKGKMYDDFEFYNMDLEINKKTIKNVVVKSGVTYIGKGAFSNCTKLKSLKLGSTVKRIGKAAFSNCANLKTVKLNDGLKTLDEDAFSGCSKMKIAKIPSALKSIKSSALDKTPYEKKLK